jgi:hypothetical protein
VLVDVAGGSREDVESFGHRIWKQHNELVALLLAVALVKAAPAYEGVNETLKKDKDAPPAAATPTVPA